MQDALRHNWLKGETASDHDILPEIKSYIAKARLRRGVEMVKLKNRIEALKMQEDDDNSDLPENAADAAATAVGVPPKQQGRLSRAARSAIFREVVFAKVRDMKEQEEREKAERSATGKISK